MKNMRKMQEWNFPGSMDVGNTDKHLLQIRKQEKLLSYGIYTLVIITTIALMLIIFIIS